MIEKKTIVDQIEVARSGFIQIRFGLLLIDDGQEIDCKWHRTSIEPGGDVDAQIAAVNAHLAQMGKAAVDTDRIEGIKKIAATVHTSELVDQYRKARDAALSVDDELGGPGAPARTASPQDRRR